MNQINKHSVEGNELDIKKLLNIIIYYKWSIIFITVIFTLFAFIFAYYKPNIYKASSTMEVESDKKSSAGNDILEVALNGGAYTNLDTQIEIIKSRFLIKDVIKDLNLSDVYTGINKFYKTIYFYKDSPIKVELLKGKDILFKIIPKTKNSFVLKTKGLNWEYEKEHLYNKLIKTKHFELKVIKNKPLDLKEYRYIKYGDIEYYADNFRNSNLVIRKSTPKANILKIDFMDTNPQRAKEFVNSLTKKYMQQNLERKTKEATFTLKFVNEQLKKIEENLKRASKRLEEFKKKNKTVDVKESITQLSTQLADYENQKTIIDLKLSALKDIIAKIKKGKSLETLTIAGVGLEDNSIEGLIKELQQTIIKKKELLKNYTNEHPEIKKLNSRISQLRTIISKSLKNILTNLNFRKKSISKKINTLEEKLKKLPAQEQDYIGLERNFLFNSKFYSYLMEKKTETEIKKAATINQNRVLDYALTPKYPIKPKRKIIIAIGFILGLITSISLALLRAFLDDKIKSEEDIKKATSIPFLGIIPHDEKLKNSRGLVLSNESKSAIAESFRNIRTNIQFLVGDKKSPVISVTSTVGGEGKTTTSANLAAALSLLGKKVIILNLDLRKPTLHKVFEVSNKKGISNYLSSNISLDEIIHKTKEKNIDIISAGPVPPNPNELIASKKLESLIEKLKENYDFIILDTPPLGIVADSKIIIKHSDITIYIFRAEYSKKDFINLVNELYAEGNKLAIVLDDVKTNRNAYGYRYGYGGYGYGYYK